MLNVQVITLDIGYWSLGIGHSYGIGRLTTEMVSADG
jgi:hypothetical protein